MPQRPKIANDMLELIGYTPLVRLNHIPYPNSAELIAKLESQNPMDSVKDRIGAAILRLPSATFNKPESCLIERLPQPDSGSLSRPP